jgi:hypothetical protein
LPSGAAVCMLLLAVDRIKSSLLYSSSKYEIKGLTNTKLSSNKTRKLNKMTTDSAYIYDSEPVK